MATSGGVDPALLAWIAKNYPGATAVHTGDQQNFTNGVQGQGVVFTYKVGAQTYTYLLPNSVPQYGIGGAGSRDTEPAYLHDPALNNGGTAPGANPSAGQATASALTRTPTGIRAGTPAPAGARPTTATVAPVRQPATTPYGYATVPAAATTAPKPALTTAQQDAFAQVQAQLDQYGLGSLAPFVRSEIVAGKSPDEVARDLRNTPEFAARFPGIVAREKAGLPAISPGEYVSYENTATQLMRAAGFPKGMWDSPDDFTKLIAGDVSPAELNDRIQQAKDATYNMAPEDQVRLRQEFGLAPGSGEMAAYWLDPGKALPLLQRQMQAAKIGGAADRAGYAGLSNDVAAGLAQQGISDTQAAAGFNTLQHSQELFHALPGEGAGDISQKDQLGAVFSQDANAQRTIENARQRRQAAFNDGGAYATTQAGAVGLGSSK